MLGCLVDNSSCIRDISRLGAKRRRRHSETCEAVSETSGWSPVAKTKPSGLSVDINLVLLLPGEAPYSTSGDT